MKPRGHRLAASALVTMAMTAIPNMAHAQLLGGGLTGTSAGTITTGTGVGGAGTTGGYWGQGVSTATPQAGCDPAVQQMQDNNNRYMIDNYTSMAGNMYTPMPPQGFTGLSCLDQLLNSGLTGFFTPQSIDSILAAIIGAVCSFAETIVTQAEMPLSQSLYATAPLGQVVPGVSLGGIVGGAGVSVSPMMGNTNGGLLNVTGPTSLVSGGVGTTSIGSSNLASYWGGGSTGQQQQQPGYGSLLGSVGGGNSTANSGFSQPATGLGGWFSGNSIFGNGN